MPTDRIRRVREAAAPKMRRFRAVDAKIGEDGMLRLVASTDAPVRFGSWREVLVHTDAAIDRKGAHSLLVNHDPDQIAGTIRKMEVRDGDLHAEVQVMAEARLASGVTVRDAVNAGALRGVSIGYDYAREDATYDEQTRTVTVRTWRLLEMTLTPIPADADAGVRSCPFESTNRAIEPKDNAMNFEQWLAARGFDAAKLSDAEKTKLRAIFDAGGEPPKDFAPGARKAEPIDEGARAQEIAKLRADRDAAQREAKLRAVAAEHGIDAKGVDFAAFQDEAEGLRALLARKAGAGDAPADPAVKVIADGGDKLLRHIEASLHRSARIEPDKDAKLPQIRGAMNGRQMLTALARASGESGAEYWSPVELGMWAVGAGALDIRTFGARSAPNKITAGFSTLLANVAHKVLIAGLADYNQATWAIWCTQRDVPNFLQVTNAGLASGRLTQTGEGEAFPELFQRDGGYNSMLGLWGATVSLSWQTIVNDQLGGFMDSLRRSGMIAGETVDREVYRALLNATWTNATSTGAGLSTIANLDKPRAALKAKKSPAGEKMGIPARYLLHDPANAVPAQQATGELTAGGQTTGPSQGSRQIRSVESHWIGDTALAAGALTTDYYVTGDGKRVDTVLVQFLEGLGFSPMVVPFDPGAVAAEKWKIMLPFSATVATHNDGTNTIPTGMQKATVA